MGEQVAANYKGLYLSWLVRTPDKREVGGSSPLKPIWLYSSIYLIDSGGVAQLGEHLPCKQGVESSNLLVSMAGRVPAGRTLKTEYRNKPKSSI